MADDQTVESTTESPAGDNRGDNAGDDARAGATEQQPAKKTAARKTAAKKATTAKKAATKTTAAKTTAAKTTAAKTAAAKTTAKKTTAKRATKKAAASPDEALPLDDLSAETPVEPIAPESATEQPTEQPTEAPAKKTAAKRTAKKAAAKSTTAKTTTAKTTTAKTTTAKTTTRKTAAKKAAAAPAEPASVEEQASAETPAAAAPGVLFQAPEPAPAPRKRAARKKAVPAPVEEVSGEEAEETTEVAEQPEAATDAVAAEAPEQEVAAEVAEESAETLEDSASSEDDSEEGAPARRRRRRGGRRRRKSNGNGEDGTESADNDEGADGAETGEAAEAETPEEESEEAASEGGTSRRRRRRRRSGEASGDEGEGENPPNTVTRVREAKPLEQQITAVSGSTRLEAKKQRRREGREAGRRRAPIVSEAEFLARRESVERIMVVRQRGDLTQIGVLEDKVLVEHYVARESQTSLIGNIYLGRVQNVLPSMEAAFIDIGKGRNAVLYAGEVNWAALGHKEGQPRKIESVLSSGQTVLVQVTKDPIGHKGARLTSQISLAGRFLVYVPDGTTSGISRKLPDTERNRLKSLLREIVPDTAGVIVRTAAEGASEEELTRDVERLKARWEDIEAKAKGNAPQLLYGEPDLTLKVVRDLFTEDFAKLVVQGDDAWDTVKGYVDHVAPDLSDRVERYEPGESGKDLFAAYRVDEQIAKGLDRKVWLPSGGSLIIDRTEAMTVVDVNTGKFTGSGGNLEETVTKNNLEAAEEIVRQLRLRDIGGIIVVDFIDMVLESNRDLVLRRLVECLGRDRTRHQVAEVTSLGLVQMTRKRIGTGLVEAFSETCSHCQGRGIVIHDHPVESGGSGVVAPEEGGGRRSRRRGGRGRANGDETVEAPKPVVPTPKDIAALPRHEADEVVAGDDIEDLSGEAEVSAAAETVDADVEVTPAAAAEVAAAQDTDVVPAETTTATAVDEVVDAAEDAPAVEEVEEDAERPPHDAEPAPEQAPEQAPEPDAPKIVTRTRSRRGASRPVVSTGEGAVVELAPEAVEPVAVAVPEAPEPPKVVTRTRRGASREVVHTAAGDVPATNGTEPTAAEEHIEHVPIKKRGARKR